MTDFNKSGTDTSNNDVDLLVPGVATIKEIIEEAPNIVSIRIVPDDKEFMDNLKFEPGQVAQISIFGYGESTFVINSPASNKQYLQFSILKTGFNTTAIHNLSINEKVGFRGPLGNWFPVNLMENKNVLIVGGGIGLAPLRPLIFYLLENKTKFKKLTLLYAAKTPQDYCFKYDIEKWAASDEITLIRTVDNVCHGWDNEVGLCPDVLERLAPSPENTVAVTCGPPIMIKYVLEVLKRLKFEDDAIYTTLERRMKCGIGKCGRCNIGEKFVCVDGPVFSLKELNSFCESFM
jgi:NAD(P)H-flavin reductase